MSVKGKAGVCTLCTQGCLTPKLVLKASPTPLRSPVSAPNPAVFRKQESSRKGPGHEGDLRLSSCLFPITGLSIRPSVPGVASCSEGSAWSRLLTRESRETMVHP